MQDRHEELDARITRLEEVIERLQEQLDRAQSGGAGHKYYESGNIHPELDDQTITP